MNTPKCSVYTCIAGIVEYIKQSLGSKVKTTRPKCTSYKLNLQETQPSLQLIKGVVGTSFTTVRTDMWPVHVSVKHVYTTKLILACHNWNGVQNLLPSPSQYGPTVNATRPVFKTTASTKHKITENHDRAVGILTCLWGSGLKCRSGYRLTPQTLSEFRDSTSSGAWPLASSAFAMHHSLIARFDALQFQLLTASWTNHKR